MKSPPALDVAVAFAAAVVIVALAAAPGPLPAEDAVSENVAGDDAGKEPGLLTLSVRAEGELAPGRETRCLLELRRSDGSPVAFEELAVVHEERLHLLIVDESLDDYHHLHPQPAASAEAGARELGQELGQELEFFFRPNRAGRYKLFADVALASEMRQQFPSAWLEVPGGGDSGAERRLVSEATAGGLDFELSWWGGNPRAGQEKFLTLAVRDAAGGHFRELEPWMGAHAHVVGFSADRERVVHMHPMGRPPRGENDRGTSPLTIYANFRHPGYYRLYAQVRVAGEVLSPSFGLVVEEGDGSYDPGPDGFAPLCPPSW